MTTLPTIKVRLPREAAATHQGMLSIGEWSTPCASVSTIPFDEDPAFYKRLSADIT